MAKKTTAGEPLFTTQEAARFLNLSPVTLRGYRCGDTPNGPPFVRFGTTVRYRPESLREWIAERERRPSRRGMTAAKARIVEPTPS